MVILEAVLQLALHCQCQGWRFPKLTPFQVLQETFCSSPADSDLVFGLVQAKAASKVGYELSLFGLYPHQIICFDLSFLFVC